MTATVRHMKRLIILTLTILIFSITDVVGQVDHLEPSDGIFDTYDFQFEYYSKIRTILFNGLSDSPSARFLVRPSFSPENVLDVQFDEDNKKYFLIYRICDKMIWSNDKPEKITLKEFKKEIEKESAELIQSLFLKYIKQTRYPAEERLGDDGVTYVFSVNDFGMKAGKTWSPPKGTKMQQLVDISQELISLATGSDKIVKIDGRFKDKIDKLNADK